MISILLLASARKDSLQARLEEMEQEHPSPSLQEERNKKQTLKEKIQLGLRETFGRFLVKREEQTKRYDTDSKYQTEGYMAPGYKIKRELERRAEEEEDKQKGYAKFRASRGTIAHALEHIKTGGVRKGEIITEESIDQFMGKLKTETDRLGIPFNPERYGGVLKKHLPGYYQANLDAAGKELIEYLEKNSERVNTAELGEKLKWLSRMVTLSKAPEPRLQGIPLTEQEAYAYYKKHARTMKISDFERQHGRAIISAVPYKQTEREFLNNEQLRQGAARYMSYADFIKANLQGDFMLSASAVDKYSEASEFFSPIGFVMEEGRIYDASAEDITSQSKHGSRIASGNIVAARDRSIEERAAEALKNPRGFWNEYIIGDVKPRGLYFIKEGIEQRKHMKSNSAEENVSPEETIRALARTAREHGLPLYEFKTGEGFTEVPDVDKYLAPQKRYSRARRK